MSTSSLTPGERYSQLVESLSNNPEVSQSKKSGFGSGLRVNGKVFAMLSKGNLVVKLSEQRIDEMISSGKGEPYMHGHGQPTKGWLLITSTSQEEWLSLATEAMEFVSSKS